MNRVLVHARIASYISIFIVCSSIFISNIILTSKTLTLLTSLNTVVAASGKTLERVNDPKAGTIAMVNNDLKALRVAVDTASYAALAEKFYFDTTVPATTKHLDLTLTNLNKLLDTSNTAVTNVSSITANISNQSIPVITNLNSLISNSNVTSQGIDLLSAQARKNLYDLDTLEKNPQLTDSISHMNNLLENSSSLTKSANQTLYNVNHPTGVISWILHKIW